MCHTGILTEQQQQQQQQFVGINSPTCLELLNIRQALIKWELLICNVLDNHSDLQNPEKLLLKKYCL